MAEKSIEQNDQDSLQKQEHRRKMKDRFRYGNYNQYYGTRIKGFEKDPRLELFSADWFRHKSVLDVGCNVGYLTLSLAKEFEPHRVLGIDIDKNLVGIARKNIRHYCDGEEQLVGKYPVSILDNVDDDKGPCTSGSGFKRFPKNVWFQTENYVLECDDFLEMVKPTFDVVLALSITKWVHLNWGDDGLKRFFKRAFRQLRWGGRFILEPQDLSSYAKRSKLTDEMKKNFAEMTLKPCDFADYLLSPEVGFSSVEELGVPKAKSKGFERPILVFYKAMPKGKRKNDKTLNGSNKVLKLENDEETTEIVPANKESKAVTNGADFARIADEFEKTDA